MTRPSSKRESALVCLIVAASVAFPLIALHFVY